MIVTCASCLTKFNLDDSRISPKGVKVRCSRCQHVFLVVLPPDSKEEVIEDFESFAKYHEDLIETGPTTEKKEKVAPPPPLRSAPKVEKKGLDLEEEKIEIPPLPRGPKGPEKPPASEEEEPIVFADEKRTPDVELEETRPPAARRERVIPRPPPPPLESLEEEEPERRPARSKGVARREKRGTSLIFALVVVIAVLIFGVFYLWTELGSGGRLAPYVQSPLKKVTAFWNQIWGTEREGLIVGDLSGYEEKVGEVSLTVIEGKVINQSKFTKGHVKVRVVIFDQNKAKVAEKETLCGRSAGRGTWKNLPPDFLKGTLLFEPQSEAEKVVPTGKAIPFTVVFKDLPSDAKFTVEIVEAPNT